MQPADLSDRKIITMLLLCVSLTGSLSSHLLVPSLIAISKSISLETSYSSWIITFFILGYGLGQFLSGYHSDIVGKRIILLCGLMTFTFGSLAACFINNYEIFLGCRLLQGVGIGMGATIYRSTIFDLFERDNVASIFSYLAATFTIISMASPIIGSYIENNFGWHYSLALLSIIGATLTYFCYSKFQETTNLNSFQKKNLLMLCLFKYLEKIF